MSAPLIAFSWFCSLFSVSSEVKFSILDSCLSYLPKLIVLWSGHASRVILSPIYLPLNCLELLASEFNFPAWFMSSHKYHAHTHPKEAPATPSLSHFPFAPYYPSQAALGATVGCADRTPCLKDDVGASTALPLLIFNCSASFAVDVCACPRIGSSACQKILLLRYGGIPVAVVVVGVCNNLVPCALEHEEKMRVVGVQWPTERFNGDFIPPHASGHQAVDKECKHVFSGPQYSCIPCILFFPIHRWDKDFPDWVTQIIRLHFFFNSNIPRYHWNL